MKLKLSILLLLIIGTIHLTAQDPCRFDQEINRFNEIPVAADNKLIVFTGSSSVRMWEFLNQDCKNLQLVNTGFGGSHMSDLLYFLDQTVLRFRPTAVYIYDNTKHLIAF